MFHKDPDRWARSVHLHSLTAGGPPLHTQQWLSGWCLQTYRTPRRCPLLYLHAITLPYFKPVNLVKRQSLWMLKCLIQSHIITWSEWDYNLDTGILPLGQVFSLGPHSFLSGCFQGSRHVDHWLLLMCWPFCAGGRKGYLQIFLSLSHKVRIVLGGRVSSGHNSYLCPPGGCSVMQWGSMIWYTQGSPCGYEEATSLNHSVLSSQEGGKGLNASCSASRLSNSCHQRTFRRHTSISPALTLSSTLHYSAVNYSPLFSCLILCVIKIVPATFSSCCFFGCNTCNVGRPELSPFGPRRTQVSHLLLHFTCSV